MSTVNPLALSDEEFLKMSFPEPKAPVEEEEQQDPVEQQDPAETEQPVEDQEQDGTDEGEVSQDGGEADTPAEAGAEEGDAPAIDPMAEEADSKTDEQVEKSDGIPTDLAELQTFYKSIMAPFKANGRTIQVKDPSEAVQLMQMGANYTWKMQAIQPHRKMLMMLENNGLLDEGKLSFLIDLDKRDPEAIKKFIKDGNIDVMDIDTESDPAYFAGNHQVTDKDVAFHDALGDLTSTESGKEMLGLINTTWDDQSKQFLWDHPEIMAVMQTQRDQGFYDKITAEVERRITLGKIAPNTPFLQAYKIVGDELYAQPDPARTTTPPVTTPAKVKVGEKVAVPAPKVSNGDKVSAAAPTRSSPKKSTPIINPLAMSDEEFLQHAKLVGKV